MIENLIDLMSTTRMAKIYCQSSSRLINLVDSSAGFGFFKASCSVPCSYKAKQMRKSRLKCDYNPFSSVVIASNCFTTCSTLNNSFVEGPRPGLGKSEIKFPETPKWSTRRLQEFKILSQSSSGSGSQIFIKRQSLACSWFQVPFGLSCNSRFYSTSSAEDSTPRDERLKKESTQSERKGDLKVEYYRHLPQITIPLPSRKEKCRFIVKPLTNTVGDLLNMIQEEDRGVDRVVVLSTDGVRVASANTMEMLLENDFDLIINDEVYHVTVPIQEKPSDEEIERLSSVRNLVGQLYAALNVDEHQLKKEREMVMALEKIKSELSPLEDKRTQISQMAGKRTNTLTWLGLGYMSLQFGILARLTWWEYSWDIMEPVTYFVTYGTAMLCYAYFVLTGQEYILPDVVDRQYLMTFHKNAKKIGFDVSKYNELREQSNKLENDLRRLRDPLALHLPLKNRIPTEEELEKTLETSHTIMSKATQTLQKMFRKS